MRIPGYKTSEFYLVLLALVGAFWKGGDWIVGASLAIVGVYIIGRSLTKTNITTNSTYNK